MKQMNQNETIRINIDDRDIRNLNNVINDLDGTLRNLDRTINNSVGNLQDLFSTLQSSGSSAGVFESAVNDTISALGILNISTGNIRGNLGLLEGSLFSVEGALGLFKFGLKGLVFTGAIWGIQQLADTLTSKHRAADEARQATIEFEAGLESLREELAENRREHERNIQGIRDRNQVTQTAIDIIERLSRQENLSAEDKNRLRMATDFLNQHISDYAIAVGNAKGSLEDYNDIATRNIGIFNDQSTHLEVMETRLTRIAEQYENSRDAAMLLEEPLPVMEALEEQISLYTAELEEMSNETLNAQLTSDEFSERQAYLIDALNEAETELAGLNEEFGGHRERLEEARAEIARLEDEYRVEFTKMFMHVQEHGLTLGALNDTQRDVVDRAVGYWQQYADLSGEMFRRVGQQNAYCLDEILENQQANYAATEAWQQNLELLYEVYGEEVAEHFRAMGESGMHTVAEMAADIEDNYRCMTTGTLMSLDEMADGSESRATQIVNNLEAAGELASEGVARRFDEGCEYFLGLVDELGPRTHTSLQQDFNAANFAPFGEAIPQGLIDGANGGSVHAIAMVRHLAEDLGLCFETVLGINSPSRVFMGYGENIVEGLCKGIENLQDRPTRSLERLSTAMERVYTRSERTFQNIGHDIMRGLNQGLLNGENSVMNTANRIANNIARTMRQALDINSPSRVMREQIGRQIPAGIGAGIDKYANTAIDSVQKLGNDLLKINIPSMESMIGMRPSLSMAGTGGSSTSSNRTTNNNYAGLFDGATINWSGEEDIRRTMEKMARATQADSARMW